MSEENVQVVRRSLELAAAALRNHRYMPDDDAAEVFDAEIRFDASRRVFNPHVYEGLAGLREILDDIWEVWDEFELRADRFVDAGDRVAVILEERGRARDGLEIAREIAYLYTVQSGRVTEWIGGMDPGEALAAVGARD